MPNKFKITEIRKDIRQRLIAAVEKIINKDDSLRRAVIEKREKLSKEDANGR